MKSIAPQLAQTCMCHIQYNEHFGLSIYVVATVHIEPHLCTVVSLHGATLGILCPLSHSAHCVCHIWHNVHLAYYCPTFGTFHSVYQEHSVSLTNQAPRLNSRLRELSFIPKPGASASNLNQKLIISFIQLLGALSLTPKPTN